MAIADPHCAYGVTCTRDHLGPCPGCSDFVQPIYFGPAAPAQKARHKWRGLIRISVWNPYGVLTEGFEFANTITTAGHDLLASALAGVDSAIKYLAWGDDNTAPADSQTTLVNELGRKVITSQAAGAADSGEYDTTTYLGPNDANVSIEELGWFAGASASASADSGVMVARVLYSRSKTNLESIQVDRTDDLS